MFEFLIDLWRVLTNSNIFVFSVNSPARNSGQISNFETRLILNRSKKFQEFHPLVRISIILIGQTEDLINHNCIVHE